jgi:hypothetical protein
MWKASSDSVSESRPAQSPTGGWLSGLSETQPNARKPMSEVIGTGDGIQAKTAHRHTNDSHTSNSYDRRACSRARWTRVVRNSPHRRRFLVLLHL